jgi:hypothetical protein
MNFSLLLTVRVGFHVQRQWRLFHPRPLTCHNRNVVTTHFALQIISRTVRTAPVVYICTQPGLIGRWWWSSVYRGVPRGTVMRDSIIYVHSSPTQNSIKPGCKAFWFWMERVEHERFAKVEKRGRRVSMGCGKPRWDLAGNEFCACAWQYAVIRHMKRNNFLPAKLHWWMRHTSCVLTVSKILTPYLIFTVLVYIFPSGPLYIKPENHWNGFHKIWLGSST